MVQAPLHLAGQEWLVSCVSMGNPHAVVFGNSDGNLQVLLQCSKSVTCGWSCMMAVLICMAHVMHRPFCYNVAPTAIPVCLHINHASMFEAMRLVE